MIFEHIFSRVPDKSASKKIRHIFKHLAYSKRPLQEFEVLSAIGTCFSSAYAPQARTIGRGILELCKPIVEVSVNNVVEFVHFSAKE